MRKTETIFTL